MNNTKQVTDILKLISIVILDIITFILVFSIWAIVNISLFPLALGAILFVLVLVNLMVLYSKGIIGVLGIGSYASMISITILYYVIVMIYTGLVYAVSTNKGYAITDLVITLFYLVVIAGLYISGANHKLDSTSQDSEKEKTMNVNLQLMNIYDTIKKSSDFIEVEKYNEIMNNFELAKERFSTSSPFGRISKSTVIDIETHIMLKLSQLNDNILLLSDLNNTENTYGNILNKISEINALIKNREKLIIQ